eukprot:maker-scaffold286_size222086-snap-gene-0.18 protein:Tk07254 transcript:maker-scaffold286_size222086-snap-gene-0.18-mRNA-1 annotation:"solute carrier family 22 member 18"
MGRRRNSSPRSPPLSARTRSQRHSEAGPGANDPGRASRQAEATFYTTLQARGGAGSDIQVISRQKLRDQPENYDRMRSKFDDVVNRARQPPAAIVEPEPVPRRVIWITHLNVFLYATCFFIQVNTMPYLSKRLGADPTTFGQLQTAFAVAQLLGGPIYGRLGDLFGERLALMVALASAAASYLLMGLAYSLPILFLSRVPSVFMHVMQGSQMIVTYFSDHESRATALSRLGFSYGIGMVLGPTLGGYVSKYFGEQSAALLAASGSVLSLILVFFFVPHIPKPASPRQTPQSSVFHLGEIAKLLFLPGVSYVLLMKLACGVPIGVLQSMFSVIAMDQFGLPAEKNGMMLSYIGVVSLFMQGIGISLCTRFLSDHNLMGLASLILTVAYYALTLISTAYEFMMLLLPLVCALCLVNSILTAAITKTVDKTQTGTMLGLNMAVNSAIRSVAPTFGGYIMNNFGFQSLGLLGVACNVVVLGLLKVVKFEPNAKKMA